MTVTHLAEYGKGKLKNWHLIPANSGNPECLVIVQQGFSCERSAAEAKSTRQSRWFKKMHLGLAGLLHFVRNDGKGVVNYYGSINSLLWLEI